MSVLLCARWWYPFSCRVELQSLGCSPAPLWSGTPLPPWPYLLLHPPYSLGSCHAGLFYFLKFRVYCFLKFFTVTVDTHWSVLHPCNWLNPSLPLRLHPSAIFLVTPTLTMLVIPQPALIMVLCSPFPVLFPPQHWSCVNILDNWIFLFVPYYVLSSSSSEGRESLGFVCSLVSKGILKSSLCVIGTY